MVSVHTASEIRAAVDLGCDLTAKLPPLDASARLVQLEASLEQPILLTNLVNIRYLTGFTGSAALLLVLVGEPAVLITDGRYAEQSADELRAAKCQARIEIRKSHKEQQELLKELMESTAIGSLGLEADDVPWAQLDAYRELFEDVELVATRGVVEEFRRTKDLGELSRLARASAIADAALASTLPGLAQRPTERAFARTLDDAMVAIGADGVSFETIIASGPNASRPHHEPGDRLIEEGDEVICDFGALVDGYHSDMTRTIYIGQPAMQQRRHFAVVREAQSAGVSMVAVDVESTAVDAACRAVIESAGWGEAFVHGTGHGSGLLIHEAPWLGPTSTGTLRAGDVVTVEPGVYLPGAGGVRIEDSMVITSEGPVLLTRSPYDIIVE